MSCGLEAETSFGTLCEMVQEALLEAAGAHFWSRLEFILGAVCKTCFMPILEQHLLRLASGREGRKPGASPENVRIDIVFHAAPVQQRACVSTKVGGIENKHVNT